MTTCYLIGIQEVGDLDLNIRASEHPSTGKRVGGVCRGGGKNGGAIQSKCSISHFENFGKSWLNFGFGGDLGLGI